MAAFKPTDCPTGYRVAIHPATDLWMKGARYGTVLRPGRKYVHVRLDGGKVVKLLPREVDTCWRP